MSMSRPIIFIALTLYLTCAGFLATAMNNTYSENPVSVEDKTLIAEKCFLNIAGFGLFCFNPDVPDNNSFSFIKGIDLPTSFIWLNIIFVVIPLLVWILILISFFVPFVNWG